jgi:hypothetical protein
MTRRSLADRLLLWRSDQWNFLQAGIVSQPWSLEGAARFNDFFARLVEEVANDPNRPAWKAGTAFGPLPATTDAARQR